MSMCQTLTDRAGQRLMVGFDGTQLDDDLRWLIRTLKPGGLILFSRNLETPEQIAGLCRDCQMAASDAGIPPLFISIDQEGGTVSRLPASFFKSFPGNPAMTSAADAEAFAHTTAADLGAMGINMNMAPVLDVAYPDVDSIMSRRAFGGDPEWVAFMGKTMIQAFQAHGIMAVGKHFPGIGRTVLDSHKTLPDLDTDLPTLTRTDIIPFNAAISAGVAGLMLSHIRYAAIDPVWPASLSPAVTKGLLRKTLGYEGVVMTDDLDMGAIKPFHDIQTVIRQMLISDVDMGLICHKGPDIEAAHACITRELTDDPCLFAMGEQSLKRIMTLKQTWLLKE
ncbi:beta-N-acetylhexosaminidase [Desulfosarcina sp. OttesenSCG-928-A07]|nr:beta-N-acetylhexosaminidase [Desulfosarcina sp. OttesenSCG-928-A07]